MPSRLNKETQPLTRRGPRMRGFLHTDPGGNPKVRAFVDGDTVVLGDGTTGPVPLPALPAHAPTHSEGGSDPVDLTDLAGYSGNVSDVLRGDATWGAGGGGGGPHAATHEVGGGDEVTITALDGFPGGTTTFLRADGTFAAPPSGMVCSPLTDGDLTQPELIFAAGDVIMVCTP